jgi:Domain of unknown function (DUF4350)
VSPRAWKALGVVVAAVVAVNLALQRIDGATGTPGGPTSSAFATGPDGLAAYAELVEREGHPVTRLRTPPAESELDPGSTLVVLDPQGLTGEDNRALLRFVRRGGRLIGGRWVGYAWRAGGPRRAVPLVPIPELAAVRRVESAGEGSWAPGGGALPALAGPGGTLLAVDELGAGRALLLADASPLQNRLLEHADNAALGLGLAGPPGRPVVFAESVHGYGRASGLRAIPTSWRWTLGGLLVAALVWMVARGRRLGPPERARRALAPARREYVEALGAVLARTRSPAAAGEIVRSAALERLGPGAERDPAERAALEQGVRDDAGLLAAGRALARLERGRLAAAMEARDA